MVYKIQNETSAWIRGFGSWAYNKQILGADRQVTRPPSKQKYTQPKDALKLNQRCEIIRQLGNNEVYKAQSGLGRSPET